MTTKAIFKDNVLSYGGYVGYLYICVKYVGINIKGNSNILSQYSTFNGPFTQLKEMKYTVLALPS